MTTNRRISRPTVIRFAIVESPPSLSLLSSMAQCYVRSQVRSPCHALSWRPSPIIPHPSAPAKASSHHPYRSARSDR